MRTETIDPAATRGALLEAMLADLRDLGALCSDAVEQAFRAVPRHAFAPEAPLDVVYAAREVVITKRDADGAPLSSVSAPEIQAFMLEQAAIETGMSVLEIGSGGCNAALIAELVGPSGRVTSVDIDPAVVDRARRHLDETGYGRVDVVLSDAATLPTGVWDRIVVTVGAWDVDPLWIDRLAPDGIIVVPLRLKEITRSLAIRRDGPRLVVESAKVCGFIPMRGRCGRDPRVVPIGDTGAALRVDDAVETVSALGTSAEPSTTWTGVTVVPMESFASLELYLAANLPGFAVLSGDPDQRNALGVGRTLRPAMLHGESYAVLVLRDLGEGRHEFGVTARGPASPLIRATVAAAVRAWNTLRPCAVEPTIAIRPRDADERPAVGVIHKEHHTVVLTW